MLNIGLTECSNFQHICQKAWEVIYNVSHEKTLQLSREVKLGDVTEPKRSIQEKFTTTKSETVDNWMNLYFEKVADHMPDKNSSHLPAWMTQAWLHEEFLKNRKILPGGKLFLSSNFLISNICLYFCYFSKNIFIPNYQQLNL
jgi:hypothetical protein